MVTDRRFPTRTLTVDPAFVTPPADAVERIERESRELDRIWAESAPERLWTGTFRPPVPHPANSAFGTHSIFNGEPRSQHAGADFRSPAGTPIKAPNAGRIVLASSRYFSGNTVVIDHGLGLFSFFAHLSVIRTRAGEVVRTGQVIGTVGATGRATGPHLHWSVRANGARIDPLSLLAVLGRP
jgi:murein DD-endopeptidase MepM/ murein hydrolase activator NlpD